MVFINCLTLSISNPSKHSSFSLSSGKILLDSQASLFVGRAVYGLFLHCPTPNAFGPLLQLLNMGFVSENTVAGTHRALPLVLLFCYFRFVMASKKSWLKNLCEEWLHCCLSAKFSHERVSYCIKLSSVTQNILPVSRSQSRFSIGKRSCPLLQN